LDGVSAKFKTYKGVQANFTLGVEDGKGKSQGTKKGIVYMKGSKYRVSITGQEIFCDGNNIWTYDKAANEVTISKFDPSVNTITPQKLFTNFYDKDFYYILNGEKQWITNAGFADVFVVYTKIDGEHFTAFIVEKDFPGVSTGAEEKKMGIKSSSTRTLILEDVPVPVENLLEPSIMWYDLDEKVQKQIKSARLQLAQEFRTLIGVS